jgi:NAD+ synthase (glutamine-hydrolysing)
VLGISGGVDSTLALIVIAKAFDLIGKPRADILCITMPCYGTTDRTYQNACALTNAFGATLREIPVKAAVTQHLSDISHSGERDVTYENAQARERTQVLMDVANQTGGIVVGTGDLSELALGWATYGGDHLSSYGVNASVPKTLVRYLVSAYAEGVKEQNPTLAHHLIDVVLTPVSPELLPPSEGEIAQKTEDLVGPYELHDFFLYHFMKGDVPSKIYRLAKYAFDGEYDGNTIYKWLQKFISRFFSQQFKRSCSPDGVKVGSVALSPRGDLKMPSDASPWVWLDELESNK